MLEEATAKQHYGEHDGKPFFADLVAFITRSPSWRWWSRARAPRWCAR